MKKPKFPRCILPPNKVKPSKKVYDRKNIRKEIQKDPKNMRKKDYDFPVCGRVLAF